MPKAYSQDLRDRVIDAVEKDGMSCRAAARRFGDQMGAARKTRRGSVLRRHGRASSLENQT